MPAGVSLIEFDSLAVGCMLVGMLAVSGLLGITLRHASSLTTANAKLATLAARDGLTGLANRRSLDQSLEAECRRATRHGRPLSLLLLDVDRFKSFNDRYGHQAGDACLKQISSAIAEAATRPGDMAARYGGEEFALMLPETDETGAARIAERARRAIEELGIPHDGNCAFGGVVTISIGCATMTPLASATAGPSLLAEADRLLYEAKRLGRNRFIAAANGTDAPLNPSDEERLRLVAAYRSAGVGERSDNVDRIARMAAVLLGTPGAFVALLDRDAIAIIGQYGIEDGFAGPSHALCAQALGRQIPMIFRDVANDTPARILQPDSGFRFMAAAPLLAPGGAHHLGALWIVDRSARPALDDAQTTLLVSLAALVVEDLDERRNIWDVAKLRAA